MAALHNRVSQKELKERLYQETDARTTISFYRYFPIGDPGAFRDRRPVIDETAGLGQGPATRELV